jgi:hypothetical protein
MRSWPPELAREVAAMPTDPAPEAATRLQVDVPRLLEQLEAEFGEDDDARRGAVGRWRDECRLVLP